MFEVLAIRIKREEIFSIVVFRTSWREGLSKAAFLPRVRRCLIDTAVSPKEEI